MGTISKELRRLSGQIGNVIHHHRVNPFPRTRRKAKPESLRRHPEWEIRSPLEFFATHISTMGEGPFFVLQIGAYDGKFDDPIAGLIRKYGWHGLLVEPQIQAFEQLRENYRDQTQLRFENAAVGDHDGTLTMYSLRDVSSHLASFDRRHLVRHSQRPGDIIEHEVQSLTLNTLLSRHGVKRVDLLQIDAEGYDGEIIRAIDFAQLRPPLIRYEHANLLEAERNDCIELLVSKGYRIFLEDSDTIAFRQPDEAGG